MCIVIATSGCRNNPPIFFYKSFSLGPNRPVCATSLPKCSHPFSPQGNWEGESEYKTMISNSKAPPMEAHAAETEIVGRRGLDFFLTGQKTSKQTKHQNRAENQPESSPILPPKRYNRSRKKTLHFSAIKSDGAFQPATWN